MTWIDGPPPKRDDGTVVLVILKPEYVEHEYHGEPVAVCCWGTKLKTTLDPLRLSYDDVLKWTVVPTPSPGRVGFRQTKKSIALNIDAIRRQMQEEANG